MKQMAIEIAKLQQQLKDQSSTGTLTPSPVGKDAKPPQPERMGLVSARLSVVWTAFCLQLD